MRTGIPYEQFDIDGNVIRKKPKSKRRKDAYARIINWKDRLITEALELKLPNEFKGSIENYNHLSYGGMCQIDDNQYCC